MGYMFFQEQLDWMAKTTKALNELGFNDEHFNLKVQLLDGDGDVVGEWFDEIGPDVWSFEVKK